MAGMLSPAQRLAPPTTARSSTSQMYHGVRYVPWRGMGCFCCESAPASIRLPLVICASASDRCRTPAGKDDGKPAPSSAARLIMDQQNPRLALEVQTAFRDVRCAESSQPSEAWLGIIAHRSPDTCRQWLCCSLSMLKPEALRPLFHRTCGRQNNSG